MTRTYDPNLDDVFVSRNGVIRWDGEWIGIVFKIEERDAVGGNSWRAEIGDLAQTDEWPKHQVVYGRTRREAVAEALSTIEAPQ